MDQRQPFGCIYLHRSNLWLNGPTIELYHQCYLLALLCLDSIPNRLSLKACGDFAIKEF